MADSKISNLGQLSVAQVADILAVVDDIGGTPVTRYITIQDLLSAVDKLNGITITNDATDELLLVDNGVAVKIPINSFWQGLEDFAAAMTAVPAAADNTMIIDGGVIKTISMQNLNTRYVGMEPFSMKTPNDIETGDGAGFLHIPPRLDTLSLVYVHAECATAPTDATISIQISIGATDLLSTLLTIDATETGSDTAATAAVIKSDGSEVVSTNDLLEIDVDQVGSTLAGSGLLVTLGFA